MRRDNTGSAASLQQNVNLMTLLTGICRPLKRRADCVTLSRKPIEVAPAEPDGPTLSIVGDDESLSVHFALPSPLGDNAARENSCRDNRDAGRDSLCTL
jgi:hypothetical protein